MLAGKPDVNKIMVERSEKAITLAHLTEFQGRAIKSASLAGGLQKKKAYQKIIREFGDLQLSPDGMLPQVWQYACEQAGTPQQSGSASSSAPAAIVAT